MRQVNLLLDGFIGEKQIDKEDVAGLLADEKSILFYSNTKTIELV